MNSSRRVKNYKLKIINFTSKRGQSLIEALAAIAVTMLVVTSLVGLGVGAIRSATVSRNRFLAVSYAQEGMEAIRSVRDRGYGELPSPGGPYKLAWSGSQWGWAAGTESLDPIFTRDFRVTSVGSGKLQITVEVKWTDRGGVHTVSLDSYLTDWR